MPPNPHCSILKRRRDSCCSLSKVCFMAPRNTDKRKKINVKIKQRPPCEILRSKMIVKVRCLSFASFAFFCLIRFLSLAHFLDEFVTAWSANTSKQKALLYAGNVINILYIYMNKGSGGKAGRPGLRSKFR